MAKKKAAKEKATQAKLADFSVIRCPVVTEKATSMAAGGKQCVVFEVSSRSTKCDIKGAVERIFNVQVEGVRTVNYLGKMKRTAKSAGRCSDSKRAFVTLKEGSNINVVEGV